MKTLIATGSFIALALSACQTSDPSSKGASAVPSLSVPSGRVSNYGISSGAGVEQLVSQALRHHPSLIAAQQKIVRLEARIPQARALPEAQARVSASSMAETSHGGTDASIGVEQKIPFPGKRGALATTARKEADAAKAELDSLKLRLAEQVRFAYWDYYLAWQTQRINRENKEILKSIREVVDARVRANQATQADVLRITTETSRVDQQIILARQQIASARAALNALLNRPSTARLPAPKRSSVPSARSLNSLVTRAESSHPSVKAEQARLDAFRSRLRTAKLGAYPDFFVGAQHSWNSDSSGMGGSDKNNQTMLTLGVTIPFWQEPRKARIREARAGIAEMQASVSSSRAELRQRVADAWFRAKSSREMITLFDQRLIPDAKQAQELSLQAYTAGTESFVDVLDTWRLFLQVQLQQEGNRASLGKASASLKSAAAIR